MLYRHPEQKYKPVTYAGDGLLHFYHQWGTNAYAITPTFARELVISTTHIDEAVDIRLHGGIFPHKRVYVVENEYFKDRRIQVSIFMSPLNVHANFNPISGIIKYVKYHKGLFLVAWHPKSSTDNERSTVVTQHSSGKEVLFRQIAGAVARRICYYVEEGQQVTTGSEYGFIKFGSRIDLFLPLGTTINVKIGDVVKGRITKIGELKKD